MNKNMIRKVERTKEDITRLPYNTSFTTVYPQSLIVMSGIFDTISNYVYSIPGYDEVFKEVGLYAYSKDIRFMLSRYFCNLLVIFINQLCLF